MIERRRIVASWRAGQALALATLVRVEGSSYRQPGARLLVLRDGSHVGSVSGGCLEAEIVRKAPWLVRHGAHLERYSTLFDDTAEIPYGLGCGGTVDVLLERADTPEFSALMEAMESSLLGRPREVLSWLPVDGHPLQRSVRYLEQGESHVVSAQLADSQTFLERMDAPQRLFVLGAGDDAKPLVRMAALLGWTVYVLDSRPQWSRRERFPEAERVIDTATLPGDMRPGHADAVVLMSHSFEQDRAWLEQVLPCSPRYLGLLGSRHRSALLVAEAARRLGLPLDDVCTGLFSPVGLDLGGDGAEAIALSIVAEVHACVMGKLGTSRHLTPEVIGREVTRGGASRYLQTQCATQ